MNKNTPAPWVEVDADDGTFSLYGNVEGLRVLGKAIDNLISGKSGDITLELRPGGVESISLSEDHPDDLRNPERFRDKLILWLVGYGMLAVLASILLLAVFGFFQLIDFFSHP